MLKFRRLICVLLSVVMIAAVWCVDVSAAATYPNTVTSSSTANDIESMFGNANVSVDEDSYTITLTSDITVSNTENAWVRFNDSERDWTIDLDGHTISNSSAVSTANAWLLLVYSGTVTIKNGTISGTYSGKNSGAIGVGNANKEVTLNLKDVTVLNDEKSTGTVGSLVVGAKANVNISGGSIGDTDQYYGIYVGASATPLSNGGATVTVSDGAIVSGSSSGAGIKIASGVNEINVESAAIGDISSTKYGVYNTMSETIINVSGGTVSGSEAGIYTDSSVTINVSGGTVSGGSYGIECPSKNSEKLDATVEVRGGTIKGDTYGIYFPRGGIHVGVSGGRISGETGSIIVGRGTGQSSDESGVTISGENTIIEGEIHGNGSSGSEATLYAGYYTPTNPDKYDDATQKIALSIADGYMVELDADGEYVMYSEGDEGMTVDGSGTYYHIVPDVSVTFKLVDSKENAEDGYPIRLYPTVDSDGNLDWSVLEKEENDALINPAKAGYTLTWVEINDETNIYGEADLPEVGTHYVYTASWEAIEYTIVYDPNDSACESPVASVYDSETATIEDTITVKDGYTVSGSEEFTQWNTSADGTGDRVEVGETDMTNLYEYADENNVITLYAQWGTEVYKYEYTVDLAHVTVANNYGDEGNQGSGEIWDTGVMVFTITPDTNWSITQAPTVKLTNSDGEDVTEEYEITVVRGSDGAYTVTIKGFASDVSIAISAVTASAGVPASLANGVVKFIYVNEDYHALIINGHFICVPHTLDSDGYCTVCREYIGTGEETAEQAVEGEGEGDDVVVDEPTEPGDVDDEEDEFTVSDDEDTPVETNPTTGAVLALVPMVLAAAAAAASKKK